MRTVADFSELIGVSSNQLHCELAFACVGPNSLVVASRSIRGRSKTLKNSLDSSTDGWRRGVCFVIKRPLNHQLSCKALAFISLNTY